MNAPVTNNIAKNVVFFCKDCEVLVDVKPIGKKYAYRCNLCKTKNVAFGTEKGIRSFYHVKDEPTVREPRKDRRKGRDREKPSEKAKSQKKK